MSTTFESLLREATGKLRLGPEAKEKTPRAIRMENIIMNESGLGGSQQALLAELMGALAGEHLDVKVAGGVEVEYHPGGVVVLMVDVYATTYPLLTPLALLDTDGHAITKDGKEGNYLPLLPVVGHIRKATEEEIAWFAKEANEATEKRIREVA